MMTERGRRIAHSTAWPHLSLQVAACCQRPHTTIAMLNNWWIHRTITDNKRLTADYHAVRSDGGQAWLLAVPTYSSCFMGCVARK